MKYLVVDDSIMARKMTIKSLKSIIKEDVDLIEAANGLDAVEKYKENNPFLCFMDLTMPVMNGFDATQEICKYDKNANVIVISADIQEQSMQKVKESGAIGFIKKPVDQKNLKSLLQTLELI